MSSRSLSARRATRCAISGMWPIQQVTGRVRALSLANSRMDSCVITRPSPRAMDALASSSVTRNSALWRSRSSHKASASCTASCSVWSRPLSIARRTNALWSEVSCTSMVPRVRENAISGNAVEQGRELSYPWRYPAASAARYFSGKLVGFQSRFNQMCRVKPSASKRSGSSELMR